MPTIPAPNINLTPKQRFLQSGDNIIKHRVLVDSKEFERGCDFAMLEMARDITDKSNDANSAIPNALMLRGAHEFLKVFRNLSEKPAEIQTPPLTKGLNYNA